MRLLGDLYFVVHGVAIGFAIQMSIAHITLTNLTVIPPWTPIISIIKCVI